MLFVALFGYLGMQTGSVGKAPATSTKSTDTKGTQSSGDTKSIAVNCPALLPLASYLLLEDGVCPQPGKAGLHQSGPWKTQFERKSVRRIRVIIATIPDPDTVTLAHYASQSVESLRRAAEGCGYSPDRHWFPWFGDPEEDSRKKFEPRGTNPGSLLFRRAAGENGQMTDLLLVLLASETPTRGVHQPALRKALEIAGAFGEVSPLPVLEIVGPSYSGSAASLAQTLMEWNEEKVQRISIITGTATNPNLKHILEAGNRRFFAAIENDAEADARSHSFLRDHRGMSGPVAVVTEEGTAYAKGLQESGSGKETVTYTFPMEISQVRNAYQKDPELQDTGSKSKERRTGLALRFSEEKPGYETIPNWAGEAGTYAKEFALRRLGDQIAEQGPSIIKIGASDVRDVLFVGGFLRRRFDDAQMVLLDADVLYGNTEKNLNMRGAISVSTYPLLLEAQTWEGASGLLQFTNQFAQGVFNALTAHINPENMVQYGAMGDNTHPPLWLTVYSRGTNWPLAMLPSKSTEHTSLMTAGCARLKPFLGPQHSGWVLLESVLFVCTALWAWCLLPTKRWEPLWELASNDLALSVPASLAGGTLLVLNALFFSIQWHYLEWAQAPNGPSIGLGLLNFLAVFLLLATYSARLILLGKRRIVPLVLAILFACASIWITRLLPAMHDGEEPYFTAFFFIHRSIHLSSGVSPALPLTMFLGLLFLGAVAQMLSRWIAYWLNIKVTGREGEDENSVDHWTSQGCGQALVIAAGWTLLSVFLFRMGGVATFEHPRYTRLFLALFILSVIFLSYAFLRLVCLFRVLREMMRCAAKRPLGEELKQVAEMKVWGVWRFHFWNIATGKSEASPGEALRYAQASQTIIQMAQCQVFFLLGGIVLGLFALQSYPFEPSRTFINYISFFFLLIGFGTFFIFGRIESAPFLMELYGTAGRSGVSFYWKTLSRFGIPLLAVLAAQFPDLGEMLVKVLTPFLESGLE